LNLGEIKAVVFDIDGTLYRSQEYERHLYLMIVKTISWFTGLDIQQAAERLRQEKYKHRTVSRSVEAMGIDRRMFFDKLAEHVEPGKYIAKNPEAIAVLNTLRRRGYKIALHTNSGRKLAEKVLEAIGIGDNCYDVLITSDEAEPKPSQEGYLLCAAKLNVKPSEALYVGDRPEVELKPAKEMGMKTALINNQSSAAFIDHNLRTLEDLLNILADRRMHT